MSAPISDLATLLRTLQPVRREGVYAWCVLPPGADPGRLPACMTLHETEGITVLLRESDAHAAGLPVLFRAAWITLQVHSDLGAVGLTAAVATALAADRIACNVVAGAHHDHLFVPADRADDAMAALHALQARHSR